MAVVEKKTFPRIEFGGVLSVIERARRPRLGRRDQREAISGDSK